MYKKALVTGGAGFIGSHLSRALLQEGLEVIVLDDLSMGKPENVPENAEFLRGDIRSQEDVERALRGVDVVFHEAARVSIRSSLKHFYEDAETNLMGTLNLLRCCAGRSIKKLLFASSMAVYADCDGPTPISEAYKLEPISPYGISKLASEKYCRQFSSDTGIPCQILRYFNTYGVGQTFTPYVGVITIFVHRLLDGKPPVIFGDGEQRRDFVHVHDIVAANLQAMKSGMSLGTYNVGTGRGTSVREIAELLCEKIGGSQRPEYAEAQPGELRYSIADTHRIRADLHFHAKETLECRIDEVIEHYRKHPVS